MIYIITDTHFNHKKMVEWGRPADFEKQIWDSLLALSSEDLLIHLGDICISGDKETHEMLRRVKAKKILIKGNHDEKSDHWYMQNGWDFVCHTYTNHYFGKHIVFTHEPFNMLEKYGDINIHGHFHGGTHHKYEFSHIYEENYHKDFSLEKYGYKAVALEKHLKTIGVI